MHNLSGMQLGPYQILQRLGQGGMATVYRAAWLGHDMEVAVKVLPPSLAETPEFVARFEREANALARLQHPYIVPLIDFGEFNSYPYMVMPIMSGGMLTTRLRNQGIFSLPEIKKVITQVGSALTHAHELGMIHRDVKPGNVLIDAQGQYRLTDFGIAKLYEATRQFTQTGALLGTPTYMSPEQARGRPIDHRSDVYSLGVVLYEMATGSVPFWAETPVAIIFMHIEDSPPSPCRLNPAIPPELEAVMQKALAKKPEDRYQNMAELTQAVQALAEVNIIPAAPLDIGAPQTSTARANPNLDTRPLLQPKRSPPLPSTLGPMGKALAAVAQPALRPTHKSFRRWLGAGGMTVCLLLLLVYTISRPPFVPLVASPPSWPVSSLTLPDAELVSSLPAAPAVASATRFPPIWQAISNQPPYAVAAGQTITVQDGFTLLLSFTDLVSGNAGYLHLLSGSGTVALAQDQVAIHLGPDSEAFANSGPFGAGVMFRPKLASYPDLTFAGVGCLAMNYDMVAHQLTFGCYAGVCQYGVVPALEGWINLAAGEQVVLTLDNMLAQVSSITAKAYARYRAVLPQLAWGEAVAGTCLPAKPVATALVRQPAIIFASKSRMLPPEDRPSAPRLVWPLSLLRTLAPSKGAPMLPSASPSPTGSLPATSAP